MLFGTAFLGCNAKRNGAEDSASAGRSVPIAVARAATQRLSVVKTYSGPLEGEEQANIIARVSERVAGIRAHVGEYVSAGQVIVSLDKSGPASQYYQAGANFKNAEKTLERMKSLYGEGAISLQALDGAQTQFDVAKANFEAARSSSSWRPPSPATSPPLTVNVGDLTVPGNALATIATDQPDEDDLQYQRNRRHEPLRRTEGEGLLGGTGRMTRIDGKIVQLSKSADSVPGRLRSRRCSPIPPDRWFKPGMYLQGRSSGVPAPARPS